MAALEHIVRVSIVAVAIVAAGCGSDKGDKADTAGKAEASSAADTPTEDTAPPIPTGPDPVAAMEQPDHAIDRVDDTRYIVDRDAVLQLAVDGIGGWLVTTKVANGYRVDHTPDGSVARSLGFADGDVVVSVNDIALASREEVRRAYAVMRTSSELVVVVDRGGISTTRRYMLYDAVRRAIPSRSALRRKTKESYAYESIIGAVRTGIKRVGDTDYEVDRAVMKMFADNPDVLRWSEYTSSSARSPRRSRALGSGVSIGSTPSVLEELGLTKFDTITTINGKNVEGSSELRIELSSQSSELKFKLTVYRLGDPLDLSYKLVDGLVDRARLDKAVIEWRAERAIDPVPDPADTMDDADDPYDRDTPDPRLDAAITKIDDYHFTVDSEFVDELLENPMELSKGAHIVPSIKNGKDNGFKLYAIRPSSVYAKLGLRNGDTIHSMNGMELGSPDKSLDVYTKLKGAKSVTVAITRRGKPVTIRYDGR